MPTNKYFKCAYCDKRFTREDMVSHIEKDHIDELPEGFTPLRATFHIVNRKDFSYRPPCRICKGETKWDEHKGRYDQLCGKQSCHDAYVEKMRKNMGDRLGINRQTSTAEGLEKMLANRKISGRYKFADGNIVAYTGSYERKAVEFFDKVLNVKSEDIMIPGPPLYYDMNGTKHIYIPDMYYIPYNLIIEIKDGGDKPNTNPAIKDSRLKMIAKEKFIVEKTNYNYIRLTNNDFSQLLAIFADLKMKLKDDTVIDKRTIHINENMVGAIQAAIPPAGTKDGIVMIQYMQNNVFDCYPKFAVADNPKFDRIFKEDTFSGKLVEVSKNFLENCDYSTYMVIGNRDSILKSLSESVGKDISQDSLYEMVFGHKMYSLDQILFEKNCTAYQDYYTNLEKINESVTDFILKGDKDGRK